MTPYSNMTIWALEQERDKINAELQTRYLVRCDTPPLGYVLVELAKINNLTERVKALALAGSADAKSLAADAALLLEARRG